MKLKFISRMSLPTKACASFVKIGAGKAAVSLRAYTLSVYLETLKFCN